LLALLALLSGCGQPGPLYMPKPPTRAAAKATPPPAPAVPSTPATGAGSNANNTEATNQPSPAATQH
jgi:predicted small lipoprotein YifL